MKVLYNTYWVRFAHGTTTLARAVARGARVSWASELERHFKPSAIAIR